MALLQVSHEIFVFPLPIIPPQARPVHRKPDAKKRKSLVFSHFWSIFSPSEPRLKNDIEKTSKKVRKSRILAFQNLPKILSKSLPNGTPQKHAIFFMFFCSNYSLLPKCRRRFRIGFSNIFCLFFFNFLAFQKIL